MLIRTNIYLPQNLVQQLKYKAKATGTSMSDLIRQAIEHQQKRVNTHRTAASSLLQLAKRAGKSGLTDLSVRHDFYLANSSKESSK